MIAAMMIALLTAACAGQGEKQTFGALSGAALGGLLGSQFGSGSGKLAATGAGVLIGALVGSEIGRSMDEVDRMKANQGTTVILEFPTAQKTPLRSFVRPDNDAKES